MAEPHSGQSAYAKQLKKKMKDYTFPESVRREAARKLLTAILGGKATDAIIEAKRWNFWKDPPAYALEEKARSFDKNRVYALNYQENLNPTVEGAFYRQERDFPEAANRVSGLYEIPDKPLKDDPFGAVGEYQTGWGNVGLRTKVEGKDRDWYDINSTMKHELAHSQGLPDRSIYGDNSEVDAYDMNDASEILRPRDIKLPYEGKKVFINQYRKKK